MSLNLDLDVDLKVLLKNDCLFELILVLVSVALVAQSKVEVLAVKVEVDGPTPKISLMVSNMMSLGNWVEEREEREG